MPGSLDRADRFFTNVERIVRESELPALSADSRKFFSTTSAQIEAIASNLGGLVGADGTLSKFADEARAAIDAADLPASGRATREAMDRPTCGPGSARSLPAMRECSSSFANCAPAPGTAGVGGPRNPAGSETEMIRRSGRNARPGGGLYGRLPCSLNARRRFQPHDRTTAGQPGAVSPYPERRSSARTRGRGRIGRRGQTSGRW
jgi:hypothetical protein